MVGLLLAWVGRLSAVSSANAGDTTLEILGGAGPTIRVDGTALQLSRACTLGLSGPQDCRFHLSGAAQEVAPLPSWKPRFTDGSFLRLTFNACGTGPLMPGCNTYSAPRFDHAAGWSVKGKSGDWIVQIDSVEFETSPFAFHPDPVTGTMVLDPGSSSLVLRPRWARIPSGARAVKWTDTVSAPAWTTSGTPGLDPRKARIPLLRWLGNTPGRLTDLTCRLRDSSGRMWMSASTNIGAPLAAFLVLDRDSLRPRLGGMLSNVSPVMVQPLPHAGRPAPVVPIDIPVGGTWDLEVSLGWYGGGQAMHATMPAPGPAGEPAPGWQKLSATWCWTLDGVRDSIVVLGWIPTLTTTSVPRAEEARGPGTRRQVDAIGRTFRSQVVGPPRGKVGLPAP